MELEAGTHQGGSQLTPASAALAFRPAWEATVPLQSAEHAVSLASTPACTSLACGSLALDPACFSDNALMQHVPRTRSCQGTLAPQSPGRR